MGVRTMFCSMMPRSTVCRAYVGLWRARAESESRSSGRDEDGERSVARTRSEAVGKADRRIGVNVLEIFLWPLQDAELCIIGRAMSAMGSTNIRKEPRSNSVSPPWSEASCTSGSPSTTATSDVRHLPFWLRALFDPILCTHYPVLRLIPTAGA